MPFRLLPPPALSLSSTTLYHLSLGFRVALCPLVSLKMSNFIFALVSAKRTAERVLVGNHQNKPRYKKSDPNVEVKNDETRDEQATVQVTGGEAETKQEPKAEHAPASEILEDILDKDAGAELAETPEQTTEVQETAHAEQDPESLATDGADTDGNEMLTQLQLPGDSQWIVERRRNDPRGE